MQIRGAESALLYFLDSVTASLYITYTAKTLGGSQSGKAACFWRQSSVWQTCNCDKINEGLSILSHSLDLLVAPIS